MYITLGFYAAICQMTLRLECVCMYVCMYVCTCACIHFISYLSAMSTSSSRVVISLTCLFTCRCRRHIARIVYVSRLGAYNMYNLHCNGGPAAPAVFCALFWSGSGTVVLGRLKAEGAMRSFAHACAKCSQSGASIYGRRRPPPPPD